MNSSNFVTILSVFIIVSVVAYISNPVFAESAIRLKFDGEEYDVSYNIVNAKIKDIEIDPDFLDILIHLTSNNEHDGFLTINFPNTLFEKISGPLCIVDMIILIDGEETEFTQRTQGSNVILELQIPSESQLIEILAGNLPGPGSNNRILGLPYSIIVTPGQLASLTGTFTSFCGKPITDQSLLEKASFKFNTNIGFLQSQIVRPDKDGVVNIDFIIPADTEPDSYEIIITNAVVGLLPVYEKMSVAVIAPSSTGTNPTKGIIISEVELGSSNDTQWIEVYNTTDREISLATMYINSTDGKNIQILGGLSGLAPHNYQVVQINAIDHTVWFNISNINNAITIYPYSPDAQGVDKPPLWDRTVILTDRFGDSRTWQVYGNQWVFIEETPSRAVPEFPVVWIILIASFLVVSLYARYSRRFKYARI